MRVKHEQIEFRISRRTLWVGMQAYPLHQVTRVQPLELSLNRGRAVGRYARKVGAWLGLGLAGLILLGCLGDAVPPVGWVVYAAVVLGAILLHTVQLIRRLSLPTLHILSVATAGSPRAALVSRDRALIHALVHRVVDAIDNPAMEYAIRVEHLEIVQGDKVGGDKFLGDRVEGNKIEWS